MLRLTVGGLAGSFTCLWLLGCSGDASLGGNQKEQGVNQETSTTAESSTSDSGSVTTSGASTNGSGATGGTAADAVSGGSTTTSDGSASGGSSGASGSAVGGTGGSATGGSANSTGGSAGSSSNSSAGGSGGAATNGATTDSGTTSIPNCEAVACLRAIECVEQCGGPVLQSGCCPCEAGTIDRVTECQDLCDDGATMEDDCNTCTCVGGSWACTERACEAPACGGFLGDTCAADEYCAYVPGQYCGAADASATCQPRPEACTTDVNPVCGCDGNTYSNSCVAAAAGTGVNTEGPCASN